VNTPTQRSVRAHPPRPRLVFRVGIVGHRPNRLASADLACLSAQLRLVLKAVKHRVETFGHTHAELFSGPPPILRAVSPLAEGADRLFAEAALELGFELCCVMPFPQEEFENDFLPPGALEPASHERFRALLARAERETALTTFEMDGDRLHPELAYGACGHVVLNQSDLLVVVWDGKRLGKRGGTEDTFDEAGRKGVPIVWIDACQPHGYRLLRAVSGLPARPDPHDASQLGVLDDVVSQALDLPSSKATSSAIVQSSRGITIEDFLAEHPRAFNVAPWWRIFRDLLGDGTWRVPDLRSRGYETAVEDEWAPDESSAHARIIDRLRGFYAWPDKLAVHYSDVYRSAFVLAYLFAGAAVGMALLPLALGWNVFEPHVTEAMFISAEFGLILTILIIIWRGRRAKWHERWIDYRLAAELVRHLRLAAPLGSMRPFPQVPAQWASYGDPASTWMAWFVRAVERDLGLPSVRLDVAHLRSCATDLLTAIRGQIDFHRTSARRSHHIEHRLHVVGLGLLASTILACIAHLLFGAGALTTERSWVLGSLVFAAGFLPALGAAIAGITNQGEFRRLGMRSEAMFRRLADLESRAKGLLDKLNAAGPDVWIPSASGEVSEVAVQAAQLMVNEVLDWRIVFLDRPLKEP
jgi:hypothetical protein